MIYQVLTAISNAFDDHHLDNQPTQIDRFNQRREAEERRGCIVVPPSIESRYARRYIHKYTKANTTGNDINMAVHTRVLKDDHGVPPIGSISSAERPAKKVPQSSINNNVHRDHDNHLL
jgi:hypothetical protein